jgi:hypothetical protein
VAQTTTLPVQPTGSRAKRSRLLFTLGGLAVGLGLGVASAVFDCLTEPVDLHRVALPTYLLVYPLAGLGMGWLLYRNPYARQRVRPPGFFAVEPLPPEKAEESRRRIRRSMAVGFGTGLVIALVGAVLDFAWRGWPYVAWLLIHSLIVYPVGGMWGGYVLSLRPGDPKPSIRNFRFRMRTLMILVAYVALVFGLGKQATRYSVLASQYRSKVLAAQAIVDVLERQAQLNLVNPARYARLVGYHSRLVTKYTRAMQRPWEPVEPEPPAPK